MPNRIIYWFRNDLRLHDNEAFSQAIEKADEIIPVYIFDPRKFEVNGLGIRKTGAVRAQFIINAVANLRNSIRQKGGELYIRVGEPEKVISEMANNLTVTEVHTSKEITLEETNVESSLSKRLKVINVDFELMWMNTLFHPRDLPFYISGLPMDYASFQEALQNYWRIRQPLPAPASVAINDQLHPETVPSLSDLGFTPEELTDLPQTQPYRAEPEKEVLSQIAAGQVPVATLLFWTSTEIISPRFAFHSAKPPSVKAELLKTLLWWDYLHFTTLRYGTRVFRSSGIAHRIDQVWNRDVAAFQAWTDGATRSDPVNQLMKKLANEGYLTYREKKQAADFLIHDLGVDWCWGAKWFESKLINYEVATNWGDWNYFAGVAFGKAPEEDLE